MSFKRILVAVDGGSVALNAAQTGLALANALGAKLATVYVVDPELGYGGDIVLSASDAQAIAHDKDAEVLARLRQSLNLPADAEHFVRIGHVAHVIDRAATDWAADLIVIGSHARTGLSRIVLGSVSETLIHTSTCPVLVVREVP